MAASEHFFQHVFHRILFSALYHKALYGKNRAGRAVGVGELTGRIEQVRVAHRFYSADEKRER